MVEEGQAGENRKFISSIGTVLAQKVHFGLILRVADMHVLNVSTWSAKVS
jgi:hypothetical protein